MLGSLLNALTKPLIGIGIIDIWKLAKQTKLNKIKAEQLFQKKYLREAVRVTSENLSRWSKKTSFLEKLVRILLLGDILEQLEKQLCQWQETLAEADTLLGNAKNLLRSDTGNPFVVYNLIEAISVYERCLEIIQEGNLVQVIDDLKQEVAKRQQFRELCNEAKNYSSRYCFKDAVRVYELAQKLYDVDVLQEYIREAKEHFQAEEVYLIGFKKAQQACSNGNFQLAYRLLTNVLQNFPRPEGMSFLEKVEKIIKGKEKFYEGLQAEQDGHLEIATSLYAESQTLLPELTECKIRQGILAIKGGRYDQALQYLKGVKGEQATYLRGFAHAEMKNFEAAEREWKSMVSPKIQVQRSILQQLISLERLRTLKLIEESVDSNDLESAKILSENYLKHNGSDTLVINNLNNHIYPRIASQMWLNADLRTVVTNTRQDWERNINVTTLHNYALACYYYALEQLPEEQNLGIFIEVIATISTVLANLSNDPLLKNIPWLAGTQVDYEEIAQNIHKLLDQLIDKFKESNLDSYFKLRDIQRLEKMALDLIDNQPNLTSKIQELYITPCCYEHIRKIVNVKFSVNLWGALFTDWGLAIAACQNNDIPRAIEIKPSSTKGEIELFAKQFVALHEGCYYLRNKNWEKAQTHLNEAKQVINDYPEWRKEIDRLCGMQRQEISDFDEHLKFAQFWYDLLGSQPSKTYLAEYKSEEVAMNLDKKSLTKQKALQQLNEVLKIDKNNARTLDLIETIEMQIELEEFDRLMRQAEFEIAVSMAKRSKHQKVKFIVADMFINILVSEFNKFSPDLVLIAQFGKWAYSISPNEPAFQGVYRSLRQIGIRLY